MWLIHFGVQEKLTEHCKKKKIVIKKKKNFPLSFIWLIYSLLSEFSQIPFFLSRPQLLLCLGFPGGSAVKNPPAVQERQETRVPSLGQDVPLEEGMATHSIVLAWKIPRTEESGGLQPMGSQKIRHDWA